jgi:F0F1-type ATP synthase assembly protein I
MKKLDEVDFLLLVAFVAGILVGVLLSIILIG